MTENSTPSPTSAPTIWPYGVAVLIALVALGWFIVGDGDSAQQLAERPAMPPSQAGETVGSRVQDIVTAAELKSELSASVSAVRVAVLGMTNSNSAQAALPQLQQAAARLDRVSGMVEQLSPTAKRGVAIALAPTAARLNQLFDKILSKPDVAGVAKPTIDDLRSKLAALSQA